MRCKKLTKILCLAMATTVFMTSVPLPSGRNIVYAGEDLIYEGVEDDWGIDPATEKGTETKEVADGWLHLAAGRGNGNSVSDPNGYPAVFLHPNSFDFGQEGFISFKLRNNSAKDHSRFGVYLGYTDPGNGMFIGYDADGWFWQKYKNKSGDYFSGGRQASPEAGEEQKVEISWTGNKRVTLKLDGVVVFNEEVSEAASWVGNKIGIKVGGFGTELTDVSLKEIKYVGQQGKKAKKFDITGSVKDDKGLPVGGVEIREGTELLGTTEDTTGTFSVKLKKGTHELSLSKAGYVTKSVPVEVEENKNLGELTIRKEVPVQTASLSTDEMDVEIDRAFPRVIGYRMKQGALKGKVIDGQLNPIDTININRVAVKVDRANVQMKLKDGKTAVYEMAVKDEANHIDAVITAELRAEENTLGFEITKIQNNLPDTFEGHPVQTIEIPNHSLVSVKESDPGFRFKGAKMSSNTTKSGDTGFDSLPPGRYKEDFMYAFISNDEFSAGLWSNSEHEGSSVAPYVRAGGSSNTRVWATKEKNSKGDSLGLSSAAWYYHRKITDSQNRNHLVSETEMPKAKIVITGDANGDNAVDWQDGAIAFRKIMNNPYKNEAVPELVAWRIAMNFGGQAQNPFLVTLDNVKRVSMHTDGLGQSVLLKGYGNEGHDSGHPDYADIGRRIGGAKDMNFLMEKGAEYGARFGIHVNAGEMYPEAKAFTNDSVRRRFGSLSYGWNWIDQGVGLDSLYDLATGNRKKRFDDLKALIGDRMDFVYVDIWGNQTGGPDDSWETRKLSKEINDNGWRMTTEWGPTNEYDSTFQHWATDLLYGGYKAKGENSVVMRFLRNHQKDSWVANYHRYEGAALAPLLGGYNMKDFEGWQGRNDYDAYIENLYSHNLTTKFIQHFKIMKWEDGTPFSGMIYDDGVRRNIPYTWKPEMKITLKNDANDLLVLERGSENPLDQAFFDRTITLNGKVIARGAEPEFQTTTGTESYLLPWIWDAKTGKRVEEAKEKLYHWNNEGGSTTWDLPENWKHLSEVKVYTLTDLGKTDEKTVSVVNGQVTLQAERKTPYVVYRGKSENKNVKWSEGMHLVDTGFNSGSLEHWTKTGSGEADLRKSQFSNPMMRLRGELAMSQTLTDLVPGRKYAALVGIDNRSDAKASIKITANGKTLAENYTVRSVAKNYVKAYTHNTRSATVGGNSYFQNMYVFFTAPDTGEVMLTLAKEAGDGESYFDDIRIVENDAENITYDKDGKIVKFEQDFEKNVQGIYPFVIGEIEGVEDNRIHLSELHAPYTQAGWDVKKMDDVLNGNWSVKVNGLVQRNALAFRTIPQNFRFEPFVKYRVRFKYQSGSDGIYGVVKGEGERIKGAYDPLGYHMGPDADGVYETEIVGSKSGQTWFGIYSTGKAPNYQRVPQGAGQNFGGYKDLVIDDLVIERVDEKIDDSMLKKLIADAKAEIKEEKLSKENWIRFNKELVKAELMLEDPKKTADTLRESYYSLKSLVEELRGSKRNDAEDAGRDLPLTGVTVTAGSEQSNYANVEGPARFATDGNENTIWHTDWSGTALRNQWIDLQYPNPVTVAGFRLLQRKGSNNGKIRRASVLVKKAGESEYTKVADAVFEASGWQMVNFDKTENVTNIRLQSVETLGNPANRYSAAAEVRALSEIPPENPEEMKAELRTLVDQAKGYPSHKYTTESFTRLAKELKQGEEVLKKNSVNRYEVELAIAKIQKAIEGLKAGVPNYLLEEEEEESRLREKEMKEKAEKEKAEKEKAEKEKTDGEERDKEKLPEKETETEKDIKNRQNTYKKLSGEISRLFDWALSFEVKEESLGKVLSAYRKTVKNKAVRTKLKRAVLYVKKKKINSVKELRGRIAVLKEGLEDAVSKGSDKKMKKISSELKQIRYIKSVVTKTAKSEKKRK